ncbi:extracellular solute-binding protein [Halomonas sp. KAO]|uniref:extracellular solute-binding protein n=1 Tax=Halomonas sp. KAO TaxID=2783858 RepID=UPI001E37EC4C|nr:extracellular solute-binding protein [Halomonas sp. KAO]
MTHRVWATALAYNNSELDEPPTSWADFWDVEKFPGKRGLRKGAKGNLEFALMADGVKREEVYDLLMTQAGIDRAFEKLEELEPHIQWWEAGAQPPEWLASGDVVMTSSYTGRIASAIEDGYSYGIVWDGQLYSVDSWAVIKGGDNKNLAFEFINYASSEQPATEYPKLMPYGVPNKAALEKLEGDIKAYLPGSDDNIAVGLREDTYFWVDFQDELNERFNFMISK